jgi:hypothetical protein
LHTDVQQAKVVEEANCKVFEFLLDAPRQKAGHETEDVFKEE